MADEIDRAQEHEQIYRDAALHRQRQIVLGDADRALALGECLDCGGEIGAARRDALPHAVTCIDCAAAAERRRKFYAPGSGA